MIERRLEALSDVLRRVVRGLDIERELRSHAVAPAFARAAGERLGQALRATSLKGGVLLVEARSAAFLHEASLRRAALRDQVNRELGGDYVRELRLRLGTGFPPLDEIDRGTREDLSVSEAEVAREVESLRADGEDGARLAARARALSRKAGRRG